MKSTLRSKRQRNPRHKDLSKEKPFFSKTKEDKQPFFGAHTESSTGNVQAKLNIRQPGDKYEKEADTIADNVVNQDGSQPAIENQAGHSIQRITLATPQEDEKLGTAESRMEKDKLIQEKEEEQAVQKMEEEESLQMKEEEESLQMKEEEEQAIQKMEEEESLQMKEEEEQAIQKMEEEESLQMKEEEEQAVQKMEEEEQAVQKKADAAKPSPQPQFARKLKTTSGKGAPLPEKTRMEMEQSFGVDFSAVKIHTDVQATQLCNEIGAQAFTHGKDIYFNTGKYNPESVQGKKLLAHELTHIVQQSK